MTPTRHLKVFLCHSFGDKPIVRELNRQLKKEGWIDAWLDEEKLLPGQDWSMEIEKAVEEADIVIVCLSTGSVDKEGYVQRELRFVLYSHVEDTTYVGMYPSGASPYGALDMAGNVFEWVADWYSETYDAGSPHSNPLGPDRSIPRAAWWRMDPPPWRHPF